MRKAKTILFAGLLALLAVGGAGADEVDRGAPEDTALLAARVDALSSALDLLRVRMEARLEAAQVLREMGRQAEALEHLRSVDGIYEDGMARVEALLGRLERSGARPARADLPVRPVEASPVPGGGAGGAFRGRGGEQDRRSPPSAEPRGDAHRAVENALAWLAAHQSADGRWEAAGFDRWCHGEEREVAATATPEEVGLGKSLYDPGVTGLALLAFLGAGYTNRGDHPHAKTVAKGLRYLKTIQDAEGCFGPRTSQHYVYNHAAAALAMVEAYVMTGSPIFKGSAQKGLDFCAFTRNPYFTWRYGVKPGENDTSVTGWMFAPIVSARAINSEAKRRGQQPPFVIDEEAFDGVRAWVDKMTDPDTGRVGYIQRGGMPARPQGMIDRFPGDKSESMTAVGMLLRVWVGEDPQKSEMIRKGARLLEGQLPKWDPDGGTIDMYYWRYGTMAAFHVGGATWRAWFKALQEAVLPHQHTSGDVCGEKGSWDPAGPWGADGGRVYATAMMTLALETLYRFDVTWGSR